MIRESQNWKHMNAPLTQKFEEKEILTLTPEEFKIPENVDHNNLTTEQVVDFVKKFNKTVSGNINCIPRGLLSLPNTNFTTLIKDTEILSFALGTCIPIKVKKKYNIVPENDQWMEYMTDDVLLYGYINYLCANEKGKGYGIRNVQAILNYGKPRGVLCGYYIVASPKTSNYLELRNWIRPLNFGVTKAVGFNFLSFRRKGDKSELRNDLYYKIKLDKALKFERAKSDDLKNYLQLVGEGSFVFYPSQKYWNQWITGFNTFTLSENGKCISVGSILVSETLITKSQKILKICNIALLVGDSRILGNLMEEGLKQGAGVAMGFQIGTITPEYLKEMKCYDSGTMFLEFYNTSIIHKAEGIMAPIY